VAAITLVELGALDGAAGEFLGGVDNAAGSALACSTNWPPGVFNDGFDGRAAAQLAPSATTSASSSLG
jgi:hypothetical protein